MDQIVNNCVGTGRRAAFLLLQYHAVSCRIAAFTVVP